MINLILFFLLSYGICNIIVFGSIFESWRNFWIKHDPKFFGKLFQCMLCLPFWVGFTLSYLYYSPLISNGFGGGLLGHFLDGCLTSGVVWLIHTYQEHLEK